MMPAMTGKPQLPLSTPSDDDEMKMKMKMRCYGLPNVCLAAAMPSIFAVPIPRGLKLPCMFTGFLHLPPCATWSPCRVSLRSPHREAFNLRRGRYTARLTTNALIKYPVVAIVSRNAVIA